MVSLPCDTITSGGAEGKKFVYADKEKELFEKPADFKKDLETVFTYGV